MKSLRILTLLLSVCLILASVNMYAAAADAKEEALPDYITMKFNSVNEKLNSMKKYVDQDGYEIYAEDITGEVAIKVKSTGQVLMTNPYDVATGAGAADTKAKLLSQIIMKYSDTSSTYTFNSYTQAAMNKQIKVKNIRDGLRVEYTIGREEVKKLVPRVIERSRFEELILGKIEDKSSRAYRRLEAYYVLYDPFDEKLSEAELAAMKETLPITRKYAVYVLDTGISDKELYDLEATIKPTGYSFELLTEDHSMTEYTGSENAPPLFRMAIEYTIDEYGLKVRMPGSSIRYDSSNYNLIDVQLLPYFCSAKTATEGYTFISDGSGAIIDFSSIKDKSLIISASVYGSDYAFHQISGQNKETSRIPAYGIVSKDKLGKASGYLAYLEEGESMATIFSDNGGNLHPYSSAYAAFKPRPSDTYALTGISATGSATWTLQSKRKYTGNYTLRIFPLVDEDASYVGMAKTLRKYYIDKGIISELEDDGKDSIPLYLENFGSIERLEKGFLGIPSYKQIALTTFEDSVTMIEDLRENGIDNINLKFTGWFNGGLIHSVPGLLNIEKALGGSKEFKKLIEYTQTNDIGFFPEMEFSYVSAVNTFDGFNVKNDTAKTVDGRSAKHRVYSALYQGFEDDGSLVISPVAIMRLYNKVYSKYSKYAINGLSVGSLGTELSSDYNDDYALNREESKDMISEILEQVAEDNGEVMINGGNAYTIAYADHILDAPLECSNDINVTASVPFTSMILHGAVNYAGGAINLEGDYEYALLKCIENGAYPYFILSYQSDKVSALKNNKNLNKYYSIRYDIWYEDLLSTYHTLNEALKDVRFCEISDHRILDTRVVEVTYGNGTKFYLNYNTEPVKVNGKTIEAMSFVKE